jgi:hypothetical protein
MTDFTASKFRLGNEIMACNHDPCNDICYDCEEKNRLIRIEAKLDRILAIVDKPKVKRKPKEYVSTPYFESFWRVYPKKKDKIRCLQIWINKKIGGLPVDLVRDVEYRMQHDQQWIDGYAPNPQTYLNGSRWQDDVTLVQPKVEPLPRNDSALASLGIEWGLPAKVGESMADYRHRLQNHGAQS